jgi:hypothetical protein
MHEETIIIQLSDNVCVSKSKIPNFTHLRGVLASHLGYFVFR